MSVWTQADIDSLKVKIASGVMTATYSSGTTSRTVVCQSLGQMRELLAEMVADVANAAGTRKPYVLTTTKKGFCG